MRILLFIFLLLTTNAYANYELSTAGQNTGIGTSSPVATLDVNGTVRMAGIRMTTGAGATKALISDASGNGAWTTTREVLTADRTYYVRTDGSDSNTGLVNNSGGAFLTLQHAYNVISGTLDFYGHNVTVQVGAGTYANGVTVSGPWTGGGELLYVGDTTTPSNVVIQDVVSFENVATLPGTWDIGGFKTVPTLVGIYNSGVGYMSFHNMVFDNGGGEFAHIACGTAGASIQSTGPYTIQGSSVVFHLYVKGCFAALSSTTVTLVGTPNWTNGFVGSDATGNVEAVSMTFSGSATGPLYNATLNGIIKSGGVTFPGNSAGSTSFGGQYQ